MRPPGEWGPNARIDACRHGIYMAAHDPIVYDPIVQDHPVDDRRHRNASPP